MFKLKFQQLKTIESVAVITALSLLGDSMLYITLPIYWKEAGLDALWQVGVLLSINRFIRLPFNPFVGWLYQKVSLRTGLMIAVVLGTLTTLGYGIAKGFIAWLVLRGLWGIAWSFFRIGGLSAVVHYTSEDSRGKSMGLYNGVYRLGSLFGMLLGGALVPIVGLQVVSILFGCLTFLGLPLIVMALKARDTEKGNGHIGQQKAHLQTGTISKINKISIVMSGFFVTMLIQGVFIATLSLVIERHYGEKVHLFGIVLSVTVLSGLMQSMRWAWEPYVGSQFGKWSDGSKGRLPLYTGTLVFVGLFFGMISSHLWFPLWIVVTMLVMAGATALTTLTDAIASDVAKTTNVVSFLTLYTILQDVGAALGPIVSYGLLSSKNGFEYLYWGGAGTFLLLAFLWAFIYIGNKKRSTEIHALSMVKKNRNL